MWQVFWCKTKHLTSVGCTRCPVVATLFRVSFVRHIHVHVVRVRDDHIVAFLSPFVRRSRAAPVQYIPEVHTCVFGCERFFAFAVFQAILPCLEVRNPFLGNQLRHLLSKVAW
ncbi:Uncharacterised protein [Vibrio cholerae]|uniref:Uncharacterized protein n=1 Tax=Vibrio cholerae TaxID=666 RepID=A0A655Z940_VIBCL|nr:Uncharacterised protein [Vibrio cholerae]CSA97675.1 Uncharacterised protein [Vibrio cholerae]CSB38797.1 Uncharacterised protein [Vibrio cholerae]CSB72350.1 Uncharacterised protein [Vibrio cholerae]CSC12466.1 Uncharacterised protein [Vibrio cholerae]